jgi:hypothetical protein
MGDRSHDLDSVARGLAEGSLTRRAALRKIAAATMAVVVPAAVLGGTADAAPCPPGRRCPSGCCPVGQVCRNGRCICTGGKRKCRGKCVNLKTNPRHCGACGNVCPSGHTCVGGECVAEALCGNNIIEAGEVCDSLDLGGASCISLGFGGGGTLSCLPDCTGFDTSACLN